MENIYFALKNIVGILIKVDKDRAKKNTLYRENLIIVPSTLYTSSAYQFKRRYMYMI